MSCWSAASEHPSVLAGGRFPPERVKTIPVDGEGIVDLDALRRMLADIDGRALVSVMLANNETGAIQPVAEIAALAHAMGAIVHTDAVQAAGRIAVDIAALGVDVLTLSAHKIGGPQGAGAIVRAREDMRFAPLTTGGGQERGLRAGTENVAAIAGFGAAAKAALADLGEGGRMGRMARRARRHRHRRRQGEGVFVRRRTVAADALLCRRGPFGRNAGDRPRPRRGSGFIGRGVLLRQGRPEPRPCRHGRPRRSRKGRYPGQSGVAFGQKRLRFVRNRLAKRAKPRRAGGVSGGVTTLPILGPRSLKPLWME